MAEPSSGKLNTDRGIRPPLKAPARPDQNRVALAAGLAVLWTGFILFGEFSGAFASIEEPLLDWRLSLATWPTPPGDQLALVAIDSIPPDRPWPWPRLDYTLMLRSVIDYVPNSIVFEMTLNDRDTQYNAFDTTFANVINRANVVVFAGKLQTTDSVTPLPAHLHSLSYIGNVRDVPHFKSALWPLETFAGNSPVGVNNLEPESNTFRLRRVPLVFMLQQDLLPSLTLQAAAQYLGADLNQSQVELGRAIFLRRTDGKLLRTIPIDEDGQMRIRFHASPPASWQASFDNIVVYAQQMRNHITPDQDLHVLRKRQIWVGRTDPDALERFETTFGSLTRVEVQMQAERTILNQDYLRPLPPFLLALAYLITAVSVAALVIRAGGQTTFILTAIFSVFWIETAVLIFRLYNIILPFLSCGLLLLGVYAIGMLAQVWDLEE